MSGEISFTGMSTGIDVNAIVDSLVSARRSARITPLENWKTDWETKLESISSVDSALSSFYTTVRGMDRLNEFLSRTVASSNESVLSASVNSSAIPGSYSVVVNQLAQVEKEVHRGIQNGIQYHSGVTDKTTSINDSGSDKTFLYRYGGTTRTLTVNSGDTLENLRDDINADPGNPGVTAKIVNYGGQDHLVLTETTPDSTKAILIDPDGDMTLNGSESTTNLSADTFSQTLNASGTDKLFTYRYGDGSVVSLTVPTGTTLQELRDLINSDPSNPGVRASILDDGGTGTGAMHLILTGEEMGADYTITLNPAGGTTLDGTGDTEDFTTAAGVFTETLSAQNAQIRIDGYPPGSWIERTTNHITDAIEGVTLDLVAPGSSTVTVSTDTNAILEKVEAFKEALNSVRAAIKEATAYNSDTGQAGSLLGNYAVQIIKSKLDSLLSGSAPGFRSPDETYVTLQQLGFSTDAVEGSETQGLLLLDTAVLSSALDEDPDAVAEVFSAYLSGVSSDSQIAFNSALPSTEAGIYDVEVDLDPLSPNYQKGRFRPEGEGWHPWVNLTGTSGNYLLTGASDYAEKGLALKITYMDGALHTSEVRLKNGVVTELSFSMEDFLSSTGPLETLTGNYSEIIDHIDLRIEKEEKRLDQYEELLLKRFARLESYVNEMNSLGSYLTQWTSQSSK